MFLGRIITESKKLEAIDFIEVTDVLSVDNTIPTLIIGRTNAEEIYGKEKVKILHKEIEPNVFWTFRKTERRTDYDEDLKNFYNNVVKFLESKVEYYYFNIFTESNERSVKFVEWLYKGGKKYIYQYKEHLYIYSCGKVFGISLNDIDYIGKDTEEVLTKIRNNHNNIFVDNLDFLSLKFLNMIKNNNIIIPYLYFLYKN